MKKLPILSFLNKRFKLKAANYKLQILIILSVAVLIGFFLLPNALAAITCRNETGGYCVKLAQINLAQVPGLEFLKIPKDAKPGEVISAIYVFGISLVGISALIMIVYGGILYMTARDSQDQVTRARKHIGNAIFGLVLALLSWLILFTINPDLVKTLNLDLPEFKSINQSSQTSGSSEEPKVVDKLTNVVVCSGSGGRKVAEFCLNCENTGGQCKLLEERSPYACVRSYVCLKK